MAGLTVIDTAAAPSGGGSGTVTSVSVTTANGVSGSVANNTTTPAISLTLGAITPSSVASTGTVTGTNLSGTNTGDQTSVTGNAGTATTLQTARTIAGQSFNGSANITIASTNLSDSASIALLTSAQTLTNKRLTKRVTTPSLASNVYTIAGDTTDTAKISTAPTANFTLANPTGTPTDDQKLEVVILSGTTGYTPSFDTIFIGSTEVPLPTTALTASKRTRLGFVYESALSKYVLIAKTEY